MALIPAHFGYFQCPSCGENAARDFPILHHQRCAYVGPSYDFQVEGADFRCPKCERLLTDQTSDWEIVGDSLRCEHCGAETHL